MNKITFIKSMMKMKDINDKMEDTCNLKNDRNLYENFERMWQKHWFQYILDNPDKKWYYNFLINNPNITWEIYKKLIQIYIGIMNI